MDKEAEGKFQARPFRCHACAARDRKAEEFAQQRGGTAGMFYAVEER